MDKIILEFEDKEDAIHAMNGLKYHAILGDVWNECFRTYRKYGFPQGMEQFDNDLCYELLEHLADKFAEMTEDVPQ